VSASKILIIDNDEATADVLAELFPEEMCTLSIATSCDDGIKSAQSNKPMLVLLNVDIDRGYYCCRQFKKNAELKSLPLILVSAEATDEQFEEHQSLPSHADAYLKKPLDEMLLASTIIELIGMNPSTSSRGSELDEKVVDIMDELLPEETEELIVDVLFDDESLEEDSEKTEVTSESPDHIPVLENVSDTVAELYSEPDITPITETEESSEDQVEMQSLIEQLANLRMAYQRAEQVYEIERSRLEEQIEALKKRCAHLETIANDDELAELHDKVDEQDTQIDALRAEIRRLLEQRNDFNVTIETLISQQNADSNEADSQ